MLKKILLPVILLLLTIAFVTLPTLCIQAAKDGLLLWFNKVLPSLLPFMIVINILVKLDITKSICSLCSPITTKFWNLPGCTLLAFILGLLSGYPMGPKVIKEFTLSGELSVKDANKTLCFCNNCGLVFIVGTVGITLLKDIHIGYFLLFIHILSALIVSFIWTFGNKTLCIQDKQSNIFKVDNKSNLNIKYTPNGFSHLFSDSIMQSVDTITYVGGYIIFFSVISALITSTSILEDLFITFNLDSLTISLLKGIVTGFLELSNGVSSLSTVSSSYLVLASISATIAFGGICVYFQTVYILEGSNCSVAQYLLAKFIQATISFALTIIFYPCFCKLNHINIYPYTIIPWIIVIIILITVSKSILHINSNLEKTK